MVQDLDVDMSNTTRVPENTIPRKRPLPPPASRESVRVHSMRIEAWRLVDRGVEIELSPLVKKQNTTVEQTSTVPPTKPAPVLHLIPQTAIGKEVTSKSDQKKYEGVLDAVKTVPTPAKDLGTSVRSGALDSKSGAETSVVKTQNDMLPKQSNKALAKRLSGQSEAQIQSQRPKKWYTSMFEDSDEEMDEGYYLVLPRPYSNHKDTLEIADEHAAFMNKIHARSAAIRRTRQSNVQISSLAEVDQRDLAAEAAREKVEADGVKRLQELRAYGSRAAAPSGPRPELSAAFLEEDVAITINKFPNSVSQYHSKPNQSAQNNAIPQTVSRPFDDSATSNCHSQRKIHSVTDVAQDEGGFEQLLDYVQSEARQDDDDESSTISLRSLSCSSDESASSTNSTSAGHSRSGSDQSLTWPLNTQGLKRKDIAKISGLVEIQSLTPETSDRNRSDYIGIDVEEGARKLARLAKLKKRDVFGPRTSFDPVYSQPSNHQQAQSFGQLPITEGKLMSFQDAIAHDPQSTQSYLVTETSSRLSAIESDHGHSKGVTTQTDGDIVDEQTVDSIPRPIGGLALLAQKRARERSELGSEATTVQQNHAPQTPISNEYTPSRSTAIPKTANPEERARALNHLKSSDRTACFVALRDAFICAAKVDILDLLDEKAIEWMDELYLFMRRVLGGELFNSSGRNRVNKIRDSLKRRLDPTYIFSEEELQEPLSRIVGKHWQLITERLGAAKEEEERWRSLRTEDTIKRHGSRKKRMTVAQTRLEEGVIDVTGDTDSDAQQKPAKGAEKIRPLKLTAERKKAKAFQASIEREDRKLEAAKLKLELFEKRAEELRRKRRLDPAAMLEDEYNGDPFTNDEEEVNQLENEQQHEENFQTTAILQEDMLARMKRKQAAGLLDIPNSKHINRNKNDEEGFDKAQPFQDSEMLDDATRSHREHDSETPSDNEIDDEPATIKYTIFATFYGMDCLNFHSKTKYSLDYVFDNDSDKKLSKVEARINSITHTYAQLYAIQTVAPTDDRQLLTSYRNGLLAQECKLGIEESGNAKAGFRVWVEKENLETFQPTNDDVAVHLRSFAVLWERKLIKKATGEVVETHDPLFKDVRTFASPIHAAHFAKILMIDWYSKYLDEGYLRSVEDAMDGEIEELKRDQLFESETEVAFRTEGEDWVEGMRVWVQ